MRHELSSRSMALGADTAVPGAKADTGGRLLIGLKAWLGTDGRRLAKMEAPAVSIGGHQSGDNMTIVPTKACRPTMSRTKLPARTSTSIEKTKKLRYAKKRT